MEMRSCDAAGGAHFSEDLARMQFVSGFHVDFGEVSVERVNAQTMIDDNSIAGKKQLLGQSYSPILGGVDRSARHGRKIYAAVG